MAWHYSLIAWLCLAPQRCDHSAFDSMTCSFNDCCSPTILQPITQCRHVLIMRLSGFFLTAHLADVKDIKFWWLGFMDQFLPKFVTSCTYVTVFQYMLNRKVKNIFVFHASIIYIICNLSLDFGPLKWVLHLKALNAIDWKMYLQVWSHRHCFIFPISCSVIKHLVVSRCHHLLLLNVIS